MCSGRPHGNRLLSGSKTGNGGVIMWKYREPMRSDFESEDDFERAEEAFWDAVDDYCDMVNDEM